MAGDVVTGLCEADGTFESALKANSAPGATYRAVGATGVVVFLVDGRLQRRRRVVQRRQVGQGSCVVSDRNLNRVVVCRGVDAAKRGGNQLGHERELTRDSLDARQSSARRSWSVVVQTDRLEIAALVVDVRLNIDITAGVGDAALCDGTRWNRRVRSVCVMILLRGFGRKGVVSGDRDRLHVKTPQNFT